MTSRINFLTDIYSITPSPTGLPNRSHTIANSEGTMKLGPELVIHQLFYVPNLMYNLISISQLLHSNPEYRVYFSKIYVLYKTIC